MEYTTTSRYGDERRFRLLDSDSTETATEMIVEITAPGNSYIRMLGSPSLIQAVDFEGGPLIEIGHILKFESGKYKVIDPLKVDVSESINFMLSVVHKKLI